MELKYIIFFLFLLLLSVAIQAQDNITWIDAKTLKVEGKGWQDTDNYFDRFPSKAKEMISKGLYEASQETPGIAIRFKTNSPTLRIKWTLLHLPGIAMNQNPISTSGFDLYRKMPDNLWRYVKSATPKAALENETDLFDGRGKTERTYLLNFPLYNTAINVSLGIEPDSKLEVIEPALKKLIVFYGTSITQGGSASRPGTCYTSIIGRKLDCEVINLGFSGAAHMEPGVCDLLADLNPSVYVIDALPNMTNDPVVERTLNLVQTIRKSRPNTPIVLVECIYRAGGIANGTRSEDAINAKFKDAYNQLKKQKVKELYYIKGDNLIGNDGEGTVDGTHPSDLGMIRMSEIIGKTIEKVLKINQNDFL